jgi:hypothetical protein
MDTKAQALSFDLRVVHYPLIFDGKYDLFDIIIENEQASLITRNRSL